jgi:hypothetical protein
LVVPLAEEEEKRLGREHVFKIVFNRILVKKDQYIQCRSKAEKSAWVKALMDFQLLVLECRMKKFALALTKY